MSISYFINIILCTVVALPLRNWQKYTPLATGLLWLSVPFHSTVYVPDANGSESKVVTFWPRMLYTAR
jgi:hypothetical protein